jgi:hypothetical protein
MRARLAAPPRRAVCPRRLYAKPGPAGPGLASEAFVFFACACSLSPPPTQKRRVAGLGFPTLFLTCGATRAPSAVQPGSPPQRGREPSRSPSSISQPSFGVACLHACLMPSKEASRRSLEILDSDGSPTDLGAVRTEGTKLCYGLLFYSDVQARQGSEPSCYGLSLRRELSASPPSLPGGPITHPVNLPFRFSCAGKAVHVCQPPLGPHDRVVLPACEGLELLITGISPADAPLRRSEKPASEPGWPRDEQQPSPRSTPADRPPPSDFSVRFLRSSRKIWLKMKENVSKMTGIK